MLFSLFIVGTSSHLDLFVHAVFLLLFTQTSLGLVLTFFIIVTVVSVGYIMFESLTIFRKSKRLRAMFYVTPLGSGYCMVDVTS